MAFGIDELNGDADAVVAGQRLVIEADGALEDVADVEVAGYLLRRIRGAFEAHGRGAADDAEGADAGEVGDDLVGEAIAEVVRSAVRLHAGEGKDEDGRFA